MKKPSRNCSDPRGSHPGFRPSAASGKGRWRPLLFRALSGILLGLLLLPAGCTAIRETASDLKKSVTGLFGGGDESLSAEELVLRGMEAFDGGNYRKAAEHFQKLKDIYPFSRYAILAELKLGDAHYRLEQYEDALFAYEEFEKLHPRNEAVPYVIYQIGRCHFDRISTPDRDPTPARKALEAFERLQRQYPGDPWARRAADHIIACQKTLAAHEFGIGRFYFKAGRYRAALERFRAVVSRYPDVGYHQPALDLIRQCESRLEETASRAAEPAWAPSPTPAPFAPENG